MKYDTTANNHHNCLSFIITSLPYYLLETKEVSTARNKTSLLNNFGESLMSKFTTTWKTQFFNIVTHDITCFMTVNAIRKREGFPRGRKLFVKASPDQDPDEGGWGGTFGERKEYQMVSTPTWWWWGAALFDSPRGVTSPCRDPGPD